MDERNVCDGAEQYRERLNTALKTAKICVFEVDLLRQRYTYFENSEDIFSVPGEKILEDVEKFSEFPPDEYEAAAKAYFSHPGDDEVIRGAFADIYQGKPSAYLARMKAGDSNYTWCKIDVTPVLENGTPVRMIGVITDIHSLKEREDKYKELSRRDLHTGLYNKYTAGKMMKDRLRNTAGCESACLMIDQDDFKRMNDRLGHAAGDRVLKQLGKGLEAIFREHSIIGRFGGDEFIVLTQPPEGKEAVLEKVRKILRLELEGEGTVSVGVAFSSKYGTDFDRLFTAADEALYRAKRQEGGNAFCVA